MRLLLDENSSSAHAETLRLAGHDAVSVVELGLGGQDDSAVRAAAIESGRVLITLDGDFANIIRHPLAGTPGVIRLRLHPATEPAISVAIRWAMECLSSIDLEGRLVVIDERWLRIRGRA